jgi:hypothetical protein
MPLRYRDEIVLSFTLFSISLVQEYEKEMLDHIFIINHDRNILIWVCIKQEQNRPRVPSLG